jgi:hypothetical protein
MLTRRKQPHRAVAIQGIAGKHRSRNAMHGARPPDSSEAMNLSA